MNTLESLKIARAALDKAARFMDVAVAEHPIAIQYENTQALTAALNRVAGEMGLVLAVLPVEVAYQAVAADMVANQVVQAVEAGETITGSEAAQGITNSWGRSDIDDVAVGVFNALLEIAKQ